MDAFSANELLKTDKELQGGWVATDYDAMERRFQEVLKAMEQDPALEHFCTEYGKLVRAVHQMHDNERRLQKRCAELQNSTVEASARAKAAAVLSEEDQKTIIALRDEVEGAWSQLDASRDKESRAKETITALKGELDGLTTLVEAGPERDHEEQIARLMVEKEELLSERDAQLEQMSAMRKEADNLMDRMHQSEERGLQLEAEMLALQKAAAHHKAEADKQAKREEKLDKEVTQARKILEARNAELQQRAADITLYEERIMQTDAKFREAQTQADKAVKENQQITDKLARLQRELDDVQTHNATLKADNTGLTTSIRQQEEQLRQLKLDTAKLNRAKESTDSKLRTTLQKKQETDQARDDLRVELQKTEQLVGQMRVQADAQEAKYSDLCREREVLLKMRNKAEGTSHHQSDLLKMLQAQRTSLEAEIGSYRNEEHKQQQALGNLQRQKAQLVQEAEANSTALANAQEELRQQAADMADQLAAVADAEARVRAQEKAVEAMRAERNQAAKALLEVQQELDGLRRKHTMLTHQMDQQRGETDAKDSALVKEHVERLKADQEKDTLTTELINSRADLANAESALMSRKAECRRLQELLASADEAKAKTQKEVDAAQAEHVAQGAVLMRKDKEAELLYEKVRLQRSALGAGHAAYVERVKELRLLKLHLNNSLREAEILRGQVANVEALKAEVQRLSTALLQEASKTKALSEELETPLNVHRWRKLEGSDPTAYELIHKVQALQRRLLATLEAVASKDAALADKQALIAQLKSLLDRRPGPEAAAQLSASQGELRTKTKALKAMAGELGMCQAQVRSYQRDIGILSKQLSDIKAQYFAQKRAEKLASQRESAALTPLLLDKVGFMDDEAPLEIKAVRITSP